MGNRRPSGEGAAVRQMPSGTHGTTSPPCSKWEEIAPLCSGRKPVDSMS